MFKTTLASIGVALALALTFAPPPTSAQSNPPPGAASAAAIPRTGAGAGSNASSDAAPKHPEQAKSAIDRATRAPRPRDPEPVIALGSEVQPGFGGGQAAP